MNRRDFIKTTATSALASMVPTWMLPKAEIELTAFCHKRETSRWDCRTPFLQGENKYATDGRIMVRVPGKPLDIGDQDRRPNADEAYQRYTHQLGQLGQWLKWPRETPIVTDDAWCPACDGTGQEGGEPAEECEACGGFGHNGTRDCRPCNGLGILTEKPCPACKGRANGRFPAYQQVGGLYVAHEFDRKIRKHLRGVEFYYVDGQTCKLPVYFRFDGGKGLLMPIDAQAAVQAIKVSK